MPLGGWDGPQTWANRARNQAPCRGCWPCTLPARTGCGAVCWQGPLAPGWGTDAPIPLAWGALLIPTAWGWGRARKSTQESWPPVSTPPPLTLSPIVPPYCGEPQNPPAMVAAAGAGGGRGGGWAGRAAQGGAHLSPSPGGSWPRTPYLAMVLPAALTGAAAGVRGGSVLVLRERRGSALPRLPPPGPGGPQHCSRVSAAVVMGGCP